MMRSRVLQRPMRGQRAADIALPRCVDPMPIQYWSDVTDAGPTLNRIGSAEHLYHVYLIDISTPCFPIFLS